MHPTPGVANVLLQSCEAGSAKLTPPTAQLCTFQRAPAVAQRPAARVRVAFPGPVVLFPGLAFPALVFPGLAAPPRGRSSARGAVSLSSSPCPRWWGGRWGPDCGPCAEPEPCARVALAAPAANCAVLAAAAAAAAAARRAGVARAAAALEALAGRAAPCASQAWAAALSTAQPPGHCCSPASAIGTHQVVA